MKIWIDKSHGTHYHRAGCLMVQDSRFPYEEVEHAVRQPGAPCYREYGTITVDGKRYHPCSCLLVHRREVRRGSTA